MDILLLIALSAIWGSSFMFMRYLAPIVGPVATADARLFIAGLVLVAVFALARFGLKWRLRWKRYLLVGLLNSGLPFLLYSFASLSLPSNVEVVINALAPGFGALFGAIWLGERLDARKLAGLLLGLGGVVVVSGIAAGGQGAGTAGAVLACVGATVCYGLAGVYIKLKAKDIEPKAMAGASQLLAGLAIMPALALSPPRSAISLPTAAIMLAFAILCSAVAYLIYYRLVAKAGPSRALTVTFLMPVFGFLWGGLFLGEAISLRMLAGAAIILAGTFLVVGGQRKAPGQGRAGAKA
jgi:drug/metabolite transporter (DMT)-like permease